MDMWETLQKSQASSDSSRVEILPRFLLKGHVDMWESLQTRPRGQVPSDLITAEIVARFVTSKPWTLKVSLSYPVWFTVNLK